MNVPFARSRVVSACHGYKRELLISKCKNRATLVTSASYGYDAVSRLASLTENLAGTANDLTLTFLSYNPAGQIAAGTRSNDAYSFTNLANQNVADTHNGLNQLTQTGSTSVTHDARGNISAIGAATFSYTAENLLSAWEAPHSPTMRWAGSPCGAPPASGGTMPAGSSSPSSTPPPTRSRGGSSTSPAA